MLPSIIEEFVREVPSHFSAYKKKDTLIEFQQFCQVEIHSILIPGLTHWLTLQPCAARILEQLNPLILFFTDAFALKPNESNGKILKLLIDPFTKCYLEFLVMVLDKFNKFNATYEGNKPLLFELEDYVNKLILDLGRCYLEGVKYYLKKINRKMCFVSYQEAKRQTRLLTKLGNLEAQVNRPKNKRATAEEKARKYALAYLTKHQIQLPAKNAPSSDPIRMNYDRTFKPAFSEEFELQKFFITSISEIQKRFSFKDHVFQILPLVKPKNVRNLCPASLSSLFKRFLLLSDHCNVVEAEKEWRSHVNMPIDYFEIDSSQSTFEFYNMDVEF
ncbi:hypothetical protein OUZ56_033731 [Daphnia magna]|uniref:Uncharacterized protein n=1 Tax=Daphnia magna TaxID=35525 RepID=A0ABQ9ZY66_9CRUS|nr:hypothetical protein OUZ56_033731 [Daphnia magna]